ncbi:MAG: hypothetical protein AAF541_00655 [Pseudomonadota bacterium]
MDRLSRWSNRHKNAINLTLSPGLSLGRFMDELQHRSAMGAKNNADWYCMMFDIHNIKYHRSDIAFLGLGPPPAYHSWMTTLDPTATLTLQAILNNNLQQPKFGIKDAFDDLDMTETGLVELFEARWLWVDPASSLLRASIDQRWQKVSTAAALEIWERAWKHGGSPTANRQFPSAILDRSDVTIFGRVAGPGYDAGVIANRSKDCVGLSNLFGEQAMADAITLCAQTAPSLPVVSYARGDELIEAQAVGMDVCGTLRVWVTPD